MSKEDFEEFWRRRDALSVELAKVLPGFKESNDMFGFLKKLSDDNAILDSWLRSRDELAYRCMRYTAQVLTEENNARSIPSVSTAKDPENVFSAIKSDLLVIVGRGFSLRLYDLLKEFLG